VGGDAQGVSGDDEPALARSRVAGPPLRRRADPARGDDITEALRARCGRAGLEGRGLAQVRDALRALQLSFRRLPGLVADGRDMGTVVFPTAALKMF